MDIIAGHGEFIFRWLHFFFGIAWIGLLYYFNFVQGAFFAETTAEVKKECTQKLVPRALWWFRWSAMITFLTGWIIIITKLATGMSYADGYMQRILPGALMGTFMWFNVWFVIWPAQKLAIAAANGETPAPDLADRVRRAFLASRTNTFLSISLLLFMGAAMHMLALQTPKANLWYLIVAIIVVVIEINALTAKKGITTAPLEKVSGVLTSGTIMAIIFYAILEVLKRMN